MGDSEYCFVSLQSEIKSAVIQRLSILDKQERADLLSGASSVSPSAAPGVRNYMDQEDLVKNSSRVTQDLTRMTKNLSRQVDQSGETIQTLSKRVYLSCNTLTLNKTISISLFPVSTFFHPLVSRLDFTGHSRKLFIELNKMWNEIQTIFYFAVLCFSFIVRNVDENYG